MEISRQDDAPIVDLLEYAIDVLGAGPGDEDQLHRVAKPVFGYSLPPGCSLPTMAAPIPHYRISTRVLALTP